MLNNIIYSVLVVIIVILTDKTIRVYLNEFYSPLESQTLAYKIAYGDLFNSLFLLIAGTAYLLDILTYWLKH